MFSVDGTTAVIVDRHAQLGDRAHRLDDRGAAGHVELHLLHLRRGLDRDPARVEGDRLADEAEVRPARARRPVAQHDQPRLRVASLGDRGEGAHAARHDRLAVEQLDLERLVLVGDLGGALGEEGRRGHVRGQVLEVARRVRGAPRSRPRSTSSSSTASPAISSDSTPPSASSFACDLKRSNEYSFRSVPSTSAASDAVAARARPGQRHRAELLGARRRGGGRHARLLGAELVARAEAGDQHAALPAAGRVLVRDGDLLQPALRLAELDQPLERGVVERIALEDADHAGVGGGLLGRSRARADGDRRHQRRQSIGACSLGPSKSAGVVEVASARVVAAHRALLVARLPDPLDRVPERRDRGSMCL